MQKAHLRQTIGCCELAVALVHSVVCKHEQLLKKYSTVGLHLMYFLLLLFTLLIVPVKSLKYDHIKKIQVLYSCLLNARY